MDMLCASMVVLKMRGESLFIVGAMADAQPAAKKLVIVESPTKAKTLSRFLGGDFEVLSSMGHVRDLPKSELGVDIERDFKPHYLIAKGKKRL